ncbi:hypothetical protein YPPY01_2039 [Yersinia pestis PY-01]|uniref:Uncharacterized protein n=3 Tax=Yersinia pseudotuberculosis complex TaxID=1649845 RepID=Q8CL03_YERPE|nr:hypothetical [Yersinia pestis KIM10+]ABS47349.1 hypothetical protein YpsIP31758_2326 [Yersinia pseudotuberculosis IP 31758]EIQ89512.1 hypothetical protein YPPY01_2039 [Yersinia pestis PY-01]EIR07275.1 hypothetical protein YPPY06_2144 [Yersinia pestis PY-06]EIR19569.1 hypothetical protein YPPY08_2121 [Yersinia pestis PY-08]EIR75415.1 hypothetical protein YPPY29_1987 [Yersinia pestis PY-29]EIR78616.1 hypothetical protein YPPY32_2381 [Yersinia pestis PY-32]EIS30006.1 hypothetical protein YPP
MSAINTAHGVAPLIAGFSFINPQNMCLFAKEWRDGHLFINLQITAYVNYRQRLKKL